MSLIDTNIASGNWYSGAQYAPIYGVSARIWTPPTPIHLVNGTYDGESNWVSSGSPNWIQTGWIVYYGYSTPRQYIETCIDNCNGSPPRYYQEFDTQSWNSYVDYEVHWTPGTSDTWCAYINGYQKKCQSILVPPTTANVKSKIHTSPRNDLYTMYDMVQYMDSSSIWRNFDQNTFFPVPDFPYNVQIINYHNFITYRVITSEIYLPTVQNNP